MPRRCQELRSSSGLNYISRYPWSRDGVDDCTRPQWVWCNGGGGSPPSCFFLQKSGEFWYWTRFGPNRVHLRVQDPNPSSLAVYPRHCLCATWETPDLRYRLFILFLFYPLTTPTASRKPWKAADNAQLFSCWRFEPLFVSRLPTCRGLSIRPRRSPRGSAPGAPPVTMVTITVMSLRLGTLTGTRDRLW